MVVNCAVCGIPFEKKGRRTRRKYCSDQCRKRMQNARAWNREPNPPTTEIRECKCGVLFTPRRITHRYCTNACRNRLYAKRRKAGGDSLLTIYNRARGTCFVCGGPCDLDIRWPDDMAPTIEHIIPISRGGGNGCANVSLSHWKCNREKGVS